jgi:hypothetical protein
MHIASIKSVNHHHQQHDSMAAHVDEKVDANGRQLFGDGYNPKELLKPVTELKVCFLYVVFVIFVLYI